ncbi:MAG: hypothetical protein R3B36_26295 [Polyangiaceae bacterium]
MRLRPRLLAVATLVVVAGCERQAAPPTHAEPAPVAIAIPPAPPVSVAVAVDAGPPPSPPEQPTTVSAIADGTWIVYGARTLLSIAADGAATRYALAEGSRVSTSERLEGVVVERGDEQTLLSTPSLTVLERQKDAHLVETLSALFVSKEHAVLLVGKGKVVRVKLPAKVADPRVTDVRVIAGGTRVNVTFFDDGSQALVPDALLYDIDTGALVGRGVPMADFSAPVPLGGHVNQSGLVVDGTSVSRIDLRTGKVVRSSTIRCPKDEPFGNPTVNASESIVIVTCGADGVVLDGATLKEKRRIPRIMPGCDNGLILGGVFLADDRTMLLQGCGGEAKLDVAAGKYTCGDDSGLLGAPYDVAMTPGQPPSRRLPAGRDRVPRCTAAADASYVTVLGASGAVRLVQSGERLRVVHGATSITLEQDAQYPTLAKDERSFAYPRGNGVVIRSLPSGAVVAEVPLARP